MTDRERKYLSDIIESIRHIRAFTEGVETFDVYQKNFLVKAAVERHLGIIGEAVNKYLKESNAAALTNARQIISLRNRIIHSYDNLDDRLIWNIVKKEIKPLEVEIQEKLKDS